MAVAACDTKGVPKRRDPSAEGGDWGSNKGDTLSVAAPGLEVMTTDVHGNDGYKPGDYVAFKGTSAAAPIVAGVAGLVLRANPGLSAAQVREIIESTAKKTGTEAIQPARYNAKGYSDEMGFGCVNAYEAVKLAKVTPPA